MGILQQRLQKAERELNPFTWVRSDYTRRLHVQTILAVIDEKLRVTEVEVDMFEMNVNILAADMDHLGVLRAQKALKVADERMDVLHKTLDMDELRKTLDMPHAESLTMKRRVDEVMSRMCLLKRAFSEASERVRMSSRPVEVDKWRRHTMRKTGRTRTHKKGTSSLVLYRNTQTLVRFASGRRRGSWTRPSW